MNRDRLAKLGPFQTAGGAIAFSLLVALITLWGMQLIRQRQAKAGEEAFRQTAEQVPIQPAVDTATPAQVPNHFSEDLVVPSFTETGADVTRQDDEHGRAPQGV